MKKNKPKKTNPVARVNNEYNKPKTFRDKKNDYSRKDKYEGFELDHPKHQPYDRNKISRMLKDEYENPFEEDEEDDREEEG